MYLWAHSNKSRRNRYGDDAPELAPILHSYGRALLEHIIATSGALGGGPVPNAESAESVSLAKNKESCFEFRDGVTEEDSDGASNHAALRKRKATASEGSSEPQQPVDPGLEEESENEEEQEEDDDMGVAFTVLDLSRVIFEKILNGSLTQSSEHLSKEKHPAKPELKLITGEIWGETELQLELAEVRNDLGDIGLETGAYMHRLTKENFEQASVDYEASLNLLAPMVPPYARRLSDAHLRLGLALEFHPEQSRRKLAKDHINQAAHVLRHRLNQISHINEHRDAAPEKHDSDVDGIWQLDEDQIRREEKDVQEMLQDLSVKVSDAHAERDVTDRAAR